MHNIVLTTGDVAKYCGVNFRTVIRWIEKGYLVAYRLPGRGDNRIKLEDFLGFLREYGMPIPEEFQELRRRVLVVEDDLATSQLIVKALERNGFAASTARDGFEAGMMLGLVQPAVMTLDLAMGGLDGFAVIEQVRGNERASACRILIVSGRPREDLDRALALGADEALAKPFEMSELLDAISRLSGIDIDEPVTVAV